MSFNTEFPETELLEYFSWYGEQISREEWLKRFGEVIANRPYKEMPYSITHNYSGDVRLVPERPPTLCERILAVFK